MTYQHLKPLPRPERQRYAVCVVPGCERHPRSFSRFCTLHARNFHRTRDPNGRAVRLSEVKPFVALAEEFLQRNSQHAAVIAAEGFLEATLNDMTQPGAVRRQLQRLRIDGATPRAMLVMFLGMWGLGHFRPHSATTDQCWAFNLGNRVLRTTPLPSVASPSGKRQPLRLPARVAEAYGSELRVCLGPFAIQFWTHVQRQLEATDRAARAVAQAIRETPLGALEANLKISTNP